MPTPSYKAAIGFAKDSANTTLSAAVAAAAVSVPIVGTGVPASSTIFIVDGALTEQRAVTAGGGTSALTVAALTNAHPANAYVASQLTASVGPADWMPVTTLDVADVIVQLKDEALRASAVLDYGSAQGTRMATLSIGGPVFTDTIGYLVGAVTGATDFGAGTPNTHAFSVKNTGDTQPTPFLTFVNDGIDTRLYAGTKGEELTLTYDTAGLFTYAAKLESYMSGPVSALTPTFGTVAPAGGWQCTATIGGSSVLYVEQASVTIKRPVDQIYTLQGIQDPYKLWSGPQTVEGSMTLVMEDNTQLNNYLNNSQPALVLTFTPSGANPQTVVVQLTKCNFEQAAPKITGGTYVELNVSFKGVANTTDATTAGTGYAPAKITCKSLKATGTYQ